VQAEQAAGLGEDHAATLRTRMGLVNVLAETGRAEMAEDICRRVEEAQTQSPELGAAHSGR
jgi:hypothetical protein